MRPARPGHAVFSAALIGLGVYGLARGGFTPVWEPVPKYVPVQGVLCYVCALVFLASGIGLLWRATAAAASRLLFAVLLLWLLIMRVPCLFSAPKSQDSWSGWGETAVMVAAAGVLYAWFALGGNKGLRAAQVLYGLAMLPFGVAHFVYLKETAGLVPAWLPRHTALAVFTGAAFLAAGVGILANCRARLATLLSAVQLGLFSVLVWVPMIASGTKDAYLRSETILSFALTAGAWVVADSYRPPAKGS